jgi:hypothetical protein
MKYIIHDWDDDAAVTILRNCGKAMAPSGRVLVVEHVIAPGNAADFGKLLDINMMVPREGRTRAKFRDLFAKAGPEARPRDPDRGPLSILEGCAGSCAPSASPKRGRRLRSRNEMAQSGSALPRWDSSATRRRDVWQAADDRAQSSYIDEPARRTRVHARTEVLVVGGGTCGVAAPSPRRARCCDDARRAWGSPRGLATGGLIILLLTLDDGEGRRVIGGLCQRSSIASRRAGARISRRGDWGSSDPERIERDRRWGLVWGSAPHRVRYSVAYDPEEMRFALSSLCEAGACASSSTPSRARPGATAIASAASPSRGSRGRFARSSPMW